ncbi:MAG: HesA/MoeB/ThiF family protein [Bacteroidales bacterium]|nr:HesA/MoeB/ThiF family protein [Bacteroidales bacterium]MCF8389650.1 HesA/MoeB/ThiF family protein [Bacteroidales bacterium]
MLNDTEKRRYNRHIMLPEVGEEGQLKLKNAKVLVVGTGGLGSPVLQYLTAAGVGEISIMDDDTVSEDNLHRQILYGSHDLGKLKTIIAKQRLEVLNRMVKHSVINIRLQRNNAIQFIQNFDLVIDATDNFSTRFLINDACLILKKPWIYGSVFKYEGQVSVFNYKGGPSIRCIFDDLIDKENLSDPSKTGLFGILPGIIGSFQGAEAIKIITGIGSILSGKLMQYNMLSNEIDIISFKENPDKKTISELAEKY